MQEFLKLPLNFVPFFEKKKLATCSLKDSIARNLHLLITTTLGENKQNLEYGAQFWDTDYDIHLSNGARREIVIATLQRQIAQHEKRLVKVALEVNVKQSEFQGKDSRQLRRRIEMIITGLLTHSNEPFRFQTGFFIGPLAFD
jgi:predicted component of type VI protein secretion system